MSITQPHHLPSQITRGRLEIQDIISERLGYRESLDLFKRRLIEDALHESGGDRAEAARMLGMHRPNLVEMKAIAIFFMISIASPNWAGTPDGKLEDGGISSLYKGVYWDIISTDSIEIIESMQNTMPNLRCQTRAKGVETIEAFANEFEALRAAIISETAAQRTYARYAEEASSEETKQLFSRLAEYKAVHLQSLEDELKALTITKDEDRNPSGCNGGSTDDLSAAIDESAGMDMAHCQFTLSISENQLKSLESANQELLRKQLRHEQELAIAADIQKKLLPQEFPQDMGIQIAASSAMAKVVGGDYYDLTTNQRGRLSLIVADSMGKGIPAALLMTTIRAIWRGCSATCCRSPGQVLETINRAMYQDLRATESFITMFGAIYDPETSIFRYSSAGHSPAIFCQASETEDSMLDVGGLPVGILPDSNFPSDEVLMREGDIIVMYTDGVVEAEDENGHLFGVQGLCDVIDQHRNSDADVIKDAILSEVDSHTNGSPLADDTTLVVLKKA